MIDLDTTEPRWRLGFRPALDGLRGIAIALVLFSHFGGDIGGQAGVTLFFVLSGFLITSMLLVERRDTGRIDLGAFYLRRGRRLLPAIVVMVAVTVALGVPLGHGLAAVTYVANWIIIAVGRIDPLSHTWSLAIEEQFYLLWPIALITLLRFAPRYASAMLVVAVAASFMWRVGMVVSQSSVERVAFGSDVRADSLLLGCALAVVTVAGGSWRVSPLLAVGALIAIVPFTGYDPFGMTFGWLFVSLLSVAAIASVLDGWRPLQWRPLVGLGRISYGVYLWHFPIVYAVPLALAPWIRVPLLIALTLGIALVSYHFVERPFMGGRRSAERRTLWATTDSRTA